MTGPIFILPQQPAENDTRERNAFGYLVDFGRFYAAHYAIQDRMPKCQTGRFHIGTALPEPKDTEPCRSQATAS